MFATKKILQLIKSAINICLKLFSLSITKLPPILLLLVGIHVVLDDFRNPAKDTTAFTNSGFAIFAALASICFSWCRSFEKEDKDGALIQACGAVSLHASILFLVASALKYTYLHIDVTWAFQGFSSLGKILRPIMMYSYFVLFFCAALLSCYVVYSLNGFLWARADLRKKVIGKL